MGRDHSSVAHPAYTVQLINHGSQDYLLGDESIEHSYSNSLCLVSHVASCVNRFIVTKFLTDPFVYTGGGEFESNTFQEITNQHRYGLKQRYLGDFRHILQACLYIHYDNDHDMRVWKLNFSRKEVTNTDTVGMKHI